MLVMNKATVSIEFSGDVAKMTWEARPTVQDVMAAFETLESHLQQRTAPLHVIVDIRSNPEFPLMATARMAVPLYRSDMLAAWLIIGRNTAARAIESVLAQLTRRHNVYWFKDEAEALAFIA